MMRELISGENKSGLLLEIREKPWVMEKAPQKNE
jgi:hypothetical protein